MYLLEALFNITCMLNLIPKVYSIGTKEFDQICMHPHLNQNKMTIFPIMNVVDQFDRVKIKGTLTIKRAQYNLRQNRMYTVCILISKYKKTFVH